MHIHYVLTHHLKFFRIVVLSVEISLFIFHGLYYCNMCAVNAPNNPWNSMTLTES